MISIKTIWGTIRARLLELPFADIKTITGLAGLNLMPLSHLRQQQVLRLF